MSAVADKENQLCYRKLAQSFSSLMVRLRNLNRFEAKYYKSLQISLRQKQLSKQDPRSATIATF